MSIHTYNWTYLSTTTREKFVKKVEDNVYNSSAALKMLLLDGRVEEYLKGGQNVVQPVRGEKMTAHGTYSGWDTLDITPPDNIEAAVYDWSNYYASIAISRDDEDKNMGEAAVVKLIQERTEEAETVMKDDLGSDLFSGGGGNDWTGLDTAVNSATYAGINGASKTWWVSGTSSTTHTEDQLLDSTDSTHYIIKLFQAAMRSAKHNSQTPNLIVTTDLIHDIYERALEMNASYNKEVVGKRGQMLGNAGFNVLEFRGVPVVGDELCPAGYVYFLNTEYITIYTHPNTNFAFTGFKEAVNQVGRVGQILFKSVLALSNRRMHYKYSGFPTS